MESKQGGALRSVMDGGRVSAGARRTLVFVPGSMRSEWRCSSGGTRPLHTLVTVSCRETRKGRQAQAPAFWCLRSPAGRRWGLQLDPGCACRRLAPPIFDLAQQFSTFSRSRLDRYFCRAATAPPETAEPRQRGLRWPAPALLRREGIGAGPIRVLLRHLRCHTFLTMSSTRH